MRTDVANLLERLGKREFHYQEFADRFADVELWPLFETLIRDPRILTATAPTDAEPAAPSKQAPTAAAPTPVQAPAAAAPATTAPADLAALFARYGGAPDDTPSDVHALLQKLAQQLEQGKL
jgi:hypothetical protein